MWDALRHGCIPVLFSSCAEAVVLHSHAHLLPAPDVPNFGVQRWSVLLNQTAVMQSAAHVHEVLAAIDDATLHAMRRTIAGLIPHISFAGEAAEDDALATIVRHMTSQRGGIPESGPPIPPHFRAEFVGWNLRVPAPQRQP